MSRAGAMIDLVLAHVTSARPVAKQSDRVRNVTTLKTDELPLCMVYGASGVSPLIDHKQRDETTSFALVYVQDFDGTKEPVRDLLDTKEAIEDAIWDGNIIDTDAAGYFAHMAEWDIRESLDTVGRWALVAQIEFSSTDLVDSAFDDIEKST